MPLGIQSNDIGLPLTWSSEPIDGEKPSPESLCGEKPSGKSPQISPVEKTPQPVLQPVEKSPHLFGGHVEKSPQFYKKFSNKLRLTLIHVKCFNNLS